VTISQKKRERERGERERERREREIDYREDSPNMHYVAISKHF
jgi:hypothetical protein